MYVIYHTNSRNIVLLGILVCLKHNSELRRIVSTNTKRIDQKKFKKTNYTDANHAATMTDQKVSEEEET